MSDENQGVQKVSSARLQAIENQLFALVRQQAKRNHPVELPSPDFWSNVGILLSTIEIELAEVGRTEGWSVKAQNLSRKQANIRRSVADLTQHRLAAFVRHATAASLTSAPLGDVDSKAHPNPLDWTRHDSAERGFYEGLGELIEKYKHQVSWGALQKGLGGEFKLPTIKAGTQQLDEYIESAGGLTGQGPPPVEVISDTPESTFDDPDEDEEDRIARFDAYPTSGLGRQKSEPAGPEIVQNEALPEDEQSGQSGLLRIRIIVDLDEPIIDSDGNELELQKGDVEFCDSKFAEGLIGAGIAEPASI